MGWLGWTPDVAMGADVNLIEIALDGRTDLLSTIFGDGKGGRGGKGSIVQRFKSLIGVHNRTFGRKRG